MSATRNTYRRHAIDKYGPECQFCGSDTQVQVHHIDGDRSNNNLDNLIPLCLRHHSKVHSKSPILTKYGSYKKYPEAICWHSWKLNNEKFSALYGECPVVRQDVSISKIQEMYLKRLEWMCPNVGNPSQAVKYCIDQEMQRQEQ